MAKGKGGGAKKAPAKKEPTADMHRQKAAELHAKARLHSARADMMDVKNPKKKGDVPGCY